VPAGEGHAVVPPPIRADHVGSLLRPPVLLQARAAHAAGQLDTTDLRAAEDQAILDVLALQHEIGLDVYSDGEFRRSWFKGPLIEAMEGFVAAEAPMLDWRGGEGEPERGNERVAGARLRQVRPLVVHEAAFLAQHAPGCYKLTLPSPTIFSSNYRRDVSGPYYPMFADLLQELVGVVQREIQALVELGVPYIQVDSPHYTHYADATLLARMRAEGRDPGDAFAESIAADNACLAGVRREGVIVGIHLCRGNSRSRWLAEGSYEPIAEELFRSLQYDRFLLEYDSERAGGFQPLCHVPPGKLVVLGLVSTKQGRLEAQDDLLRRIDEAARYVPLAQLAIGPQCGFASGAAGNLLTADDQRRKLELVVDTARKVWG
jgi:5-methyltetrahydropteroyltriglutamate--homocysteine methyltransferase